MKELEFMQACSRRGFYRNNPDMLWKISILEKGQVAEDTLKRWIEEYIVSNRIEAVVMQDVCIQKSTKMQIDLLVIRRGLWWIIEVKNYNGVYRKEKNKTYLNDKLMERDEIGHCFTRLNTFQAIADGHSHVNIKIISSLIFMNENSEIVMDDYPAEIHLHTRNSTRRHIKETLNRNYQGLEIEDSKEIINEYVVENFFTPTSLIANDLEKLDKGIICPKCFQVTMQTSRKMIHCQKCSHKHRKLEAAHNIIDEVSKMFFESPEKMMISNANLLAGKAISKHTLYRALNKIKKALCQIGLMSHYLDQATFVAWSFLLWGWYKRHISNIRALK